QHSPRNTEHGTRNTESVPCSTIEPICLSSFVIRHSSFVARLHPDRNPHRHRHSRHGVDRNFFELDGDFARLEGRLGCRRRRATLADRDAHDRGLSALRTVIWTKPALLWVYGEERERGLPELCRAPAGFLSPKSKVWRSPRAPCN